MKYTIHHQRLSLIQAMHFIDAVWCDYPHIFYDPTVAAQYSIRRQQTHDGTVIFSVMLVRDALELLFNRQSYYTPEPPPEGHWPVYFVGEIRLATISGPDLCQGQWPGERERIIIPVRVEWVPSEKYRERCQELTIQYSEKLTDPLSPRDLFLPPLKRDVPVPKPTLVLGHTHLRDGLANVFAHHGREGGFRRDEMVIIGVGSAHRGVHHRVALAAALAGISMLASVGAPKSSVMMGGDYDGNSMLKPGTIRNRDPKYKPRPVTNYASRKASRWNG